MPEKISNTLYLIYDGECILCRNTAKALKIKKSIGHLQILNARSDHPFVLEAIAKGYNLNEGILVKFTNQYYYGADALHFLSLISSPSDFFNKLNSTFFKSKWLTSLLYPVFKLIRNILLFLKHVPPIDTQKTLTEMIDQNSAQNLPSILQKRYSNKPYSEDRLLLQGEMNITFSKIYRLISPLFRVLGALVPYPAKKIPVSVEIISNKKSDIILMQRIFYYPNKPPYHFQSKILYVKDNIVLEIIQFRLASKAIYRFNDNKIIIDHGGYCFRFGKWLIPLPLGFILGKFNAVEEAQSDDLFTMQVKMIHPLFGIIFQYDGQFKIT